MRRRDFVSGVAATAVATAMRGSVPTLADETKSASTKKYKMLGVPLRSGSLTPGNENDARAYREAKFVDKMKAAGVTASDEGDVAIPSYVPHHSVPPIRSWPGPRIAWECVAERVGPYLRNGDVPLLVGCDCSVVVGSTQALMEVAGAEKVHVIYVDGDFDDAPPEASKVNSAASVGLWLLTHASPFRAGPVLKASQVTVVGWSVPSKSEAGATRAVKREEVEAGAREAARKVLDALPKDAAVLVHFDIDVMRASEMPAAYFPHAEGMSFAQTSELMRELLQDRRVRMVEVSEYAMLRDGDGRQIERLVEMLTGALKQ